MWDHRYLRRIDLRTIPLLLALMLISLLVISSTSSSDDSFWTKLSKSQLEWFAIGWVVYLFFAGLDYRKFRAWTWVLYGIIFLMLVGLFFTSPIQNVHRWYRLPFLGRAFQPSEYAKLVVVIAFSWFIEYKGQSGWHPIVGLSGAFDCIRPFCAHSQTARSWVQRWSYIPLRLLCFILEGSIAGS